nr:serine hydrolase [Pseudomaricurvus alkylphenolicus]
MIGGYLTPFFVLGPEPLEPPQNVDSIEQLDRYFAAMVEEQQPPAMDVTVLQGGKTVFAKAYGLADGITGAAATSEHVYHFWSMTKSFTAVAIFQLIEAGKLSLHDPITTYLPGFVPIDQSGNPVEVTVDHVLSHSSGLPDFFFDMYKWLHYPGEPRVGETRMVNERLQDYRTVAWEPGSQSEYTNINYVLLGAIIEAVTGGTYEDYVRQEILGPLKMETTDFVYRADMLDKAAVGTQTHYSFYTAMVELMGPAGGLDGITQKRIDDRHWLKYMYTDYAASTSLIGTGADMSRFGQMLLNQGELDGVRILSKENAKNVIYGGRLPGYKEEVRAGKRDLALGYGTKTWVDQGVELVGHGGGGPGYALQYFVVPEKELVVVVLTNSSMARADKLSKLVASVF